MDSNDRNASFAIEEFQAIYDGEIDYFLFSVDTDGRGIASSFATDQLLFARSPGGTFSEQARWGYNDLALDNFAIISVAGVPIVIREDEQLGGLSSYRVDNSLDIERLQGVLTGVDDVSGDQTGSRRPRSGRSHLSLYAVSLWHYRR